jgi:hypothetical protein
MQRGTYSASKALLGTIDSLMQNAYNIRVTARHVNTVATDMAKN